MNNYTHTLLLVLDETSLEAVASKTTSSCFDRAVVNNGLRYIIFEFWLLSHVQYESDMGCVLKIYI